MKRCHKALLLAFAIVISCWVSFIFGGKRAQFNDWHYDYQVLSYGLNRPDKHDHLGPVPPKFHSSGRYQYYGLMSPEKKWDAPVPAPNQAYNQYT